MGKKKVEYQSIDIKYPKNLWLIAIWLVTEKGRLIPDYMNHLFDSEKKSIEFVNEYVGLLRKEMGHSSVLDSIMLTPLTFLRLYPLKKEMWEHPIMEINDIDRMLSFCGAVLKPEENLFLVTPLPFVGKSKEIDLIPAYIFKKNEEHLVESFMMVSKLPVCEQAKNASIYEIGQAYAYDLVEKKKIINEELFTN